MSARSLKGKHVVITGSTESAKDWTTYLKSRDAIVHRFPTIETSVVTPNKKLIDTLSNVENFSWIIFTSSTGVYAFKELMKKIHIKIPIKKMPQIAAIGKKTAQVVRDIGWKVSFIPSMPNSETLAMEIKLSVLPILLLRADIASDELPQLLKKRSVRVVDIPIYKTKILRENPSSRFLKLLKEKKIDCILFASPSAVQGFCARIKKQNKFAYQIPAIAISPRVACVLADAGFQTITTARKTTIESMADAISKY